MQVDGNTELIVVQTTVTSTALKLHCVALHCILFLVGKNKQRNSVGSHHQQIPPKKRE